MSPLETAANKVGEHSGHSDGKESVVCTRADMKDLKIIKEI